jgi:probable rRNA maturation factor
LKLDVVVLSPLWRRAPKANAKARSAVRAAVALCGVALAANAEAALHLADDAHVRSLNARWRGKDTATNVLSFPAARADAISAAPLLGDIIVAYETLERESAEMNVGFDDHFLHLTVHGFLHLIGFDHETVKQARLMEGLERRILGHLGLADPYPDQEP